MATPLRPEFRLALPQNYQRKRRPDLELVTFAAPGADDAKHSSDFLGWLQRLSPLGREEACAEENPWLVAVLGQMQRYKAVKGESVHSVDKNEERDLAACALAENFISKTRSDTDLSVQLVAERLLEASLKVWSASASDWDTLALSCELVRDPSRMLSVFHDVSGGQAFKVPCRTVWARDKLWLRESPNWLHRSFNSLAEYAAAAIESNLWLKYWNAKRQSLKKGCEVSSKESYAGARAAYQEYWRGLSGRSRLLVLSDLPTLALSQRVAVDGIVAEFEDEESSELLCSLRDYESPESVQRILALGTSATSVEDFIDTVFTTSLVRMGSLFDAVAKTVRDRLMKMYQEKLAADLALSADTSVKPLKETNDKPKKSKSKNKKSRKAVPPSAPEEDETSYVRGLTQRLLDEVILCQVGSPPAAECLPEPTIDSSQPSWPLKPLPEKPKKKKNKCSKRPASTPHCAPAKCDSDVVPSESWKERITKDITKFCSEVERSVAERKRQRDEIINAISEVCQALFPGSRLVLYGSISTGLSLPSSDLDIYIISPSIHRRDEVSAAICFLDSKLQSHSLVRSSQAIPSATIPVLKLECCNGIKVDCSFGDERHSGTRSTVFCIDALRRFPQMRHLALVVKAVMKESGLNSAFLGGLSSYQLMVWLIAYLRTTDARQCEGELLLGFFRFYGTEFDPKSTGISASQDPPFFPLESSFAPVVTADPLSADFNLTRNCTSAHGILQLFAKCYALLSTMVANKRRKGFVKTLLQEVAVIPRD